MVHVQVLWYKAAVVLVSIAFDMCRQLAVLCCPQALLVVHACVEPRACCRLCQGTVKLGACL